MEDTVAGANRLALAVASAQARVHEVRPGFPESAAGVNRRDALVHAWVRLTGGSVVTSGDGGLQLTLGGAAVLDQPGWHDLSVASQTDGTGHLGIVVSRTDGTTEPVAVTSGMLGGLLETVNEVIPQVLAALAGADALRGGTSQDPDAFRGLPGLTRGGPGAEQVSAEYLHTQGEGRDPVRDGVLVEQRLGITSADSARAGAAGVAALQRVNAAVLSMGSAAEAVTSVHPSTQWVVGVSRPDLLAASIDPLTTPVPGTVDVTVLSAARPAGAASKLAFGIDEVLNEGRPFSFGIEQRLAGQTRATTVMVGEFPTIRDVAAAINNSAAGVRASTSQIATGTVQLLVTSLVTGHTAQVTITDGQQPPATSTILGRFRTMEGADTLDARDAAGRARQLESLVQAAGSVLESVLRATSASAAAAGDRMLAGIAGRVVGELTGPAGRALPGLTFGRHALSLDRDHVGRALQSDPVGTEAAAAALASGLVEISREVSAPGQGYLAVRLAADQSATSDFRAPHPGTDDVLSRHQDTLEQRSRALASLLDRLGAQGSWLNTALPAAG